MLNSQNALLKVKLFSDYDYKLGFLQSFAGFMKYALNNSILCLCLHTYYAIKNKLKWLVKIMQVFVKRKASHPSNNKKKTCEKV